MKRGISWIGLCALALVATQVEAMSSDDKGGITLANERFTLVIGEDATAKSLKLKGRDEELLDVRVKTPLFASTQARPFNNEIKLIHPNKLTTYPANRVRWVGGKLLVGFATAPYEAEIAVKIASDYIIFELVDFPGSAAGYEGLKMDTPPVKELRVLQLPVKNRKNFGDWLNCSWDGEAAVCVAGTTPYTVISHAERDGYRLLYGDLLKGQKLRGGSAALIAAAGREEFLNAMDAFERDLGLPRGVKNRRDPMNLASIYHDARSITPANVEETLAVVKEGGFKCVTIGYSTFCNATNSWGFIGDYDFNKNYPNGYEDVKLVVKKFHDIGVKVGLHFLHTHIGMFSRYVTPHVDPRLSLTRYFTLKNLGADTLEVYEPTVDAPMFTAGRLLKFGTELISYESYTTEAPYIFKGIKRGAWNTEVVAHAQGEIGGTLDISEFGRPNSCYVSQSSDLQDEIADKIAAIYNCGFDYVYMDGSEGVNEPFDVNVALAQYRVWKKFKREPFCAEGAAKTHFGWHMLSGANAFDDFPPELYKAKLLEFPCAQAPLTAMDMTRVDFGWWYLHEGTTPELWNFGLAKATGWDCAVSFIFNPVTMRRHPLRKELLAVIRRWEDAKAAGFFTAEMKAKLRDPTREFELIRNPDNTFALRER